MREYVRGSPWCFLPLSAAASPYRRTTGMLPVAVGMAAAWRSVAFPQLSVYCNRPWHPAPCAKRQGAEKHRPARKNNHGSGPGSGRRPALVLRAPRPLMPLRQRALPGTSVAQCLRKPQVVAPTAVTSHLTAERGSAHSIPVACKKIEGDPAAAQPTTKKRTTCRAAAAVPKALRPKKEPRRREKNHQKEPGPQKRTGGQGRKEPAGSFLLRAPW